MRFTVIMTFSTWEPRKLLTGIQTRPPLNSPTGTMNKFGDESYSKEELVAELCASFLIGGWYSPNL